MKVYLSSYKGYRSLLLRACVVPSVLFVEIIATWSLPDDSVKQLHVTFPWLPKEKEARLMILGRRHLKAGLISICKEVEAAHCWADEKNSRCSIDVTIFPNTRMNAATINGPRTGDGRPVPDMSVDANRVYWAMRANKQGDVGLPVRQIATELGMDTADAVVAGDELLEHCLISTSENDYDVWSLLES